MRNGANCPTYSARPRPLTAVAGSERADFQQMPSLASDCGEPRTVSVRLLSVGDSPRLEGENIEHIQILAESEASLPPILVHRDTMRVIDGMHRLRAAQANGVQDIEVRYFAGSEDDAFIAAVEANMAHGLPLTLADREAAAVRIIASHPQRSDRWIASVTGLAASTVGCIRRRVIPEGEQLRERTGRDGKVRPLDSADGRRAAGRAFTENPDASLRQIAKAVGISPSTARDVRERILRGDSPVPAQRRSARQNADDDDRQLGAAIASPRSRRPLRDRASLLDVLKKDPSLRHTESGKALLRWLIASASGPGRWQHLVEAAPAHCAYLVADLARYCAREWQDVADRLEEHLRSMA